MKAKKIIITLVFALLILGLKAQDKYTETQVAIDPIKVYDDLTPVTSFLNKMGNDGWEIYASTVPANLPAFYYFLRTKKS